MSCFAGIFGKKLLSDAIADGLQISDARKARIVKLVGQDLTPAGMKGSQAMVKALSKVTAGILACDYYYKPTRGDIDSADSFFGYDMKRIVVEGWSFEAAMRGPEKDQFGAYPASEFRLKKADGSADAYCQSNWNAVSNRSGYYQIKEKITGQGVADGYFDEADYTSGVVYRYDPSVVYQKMSDVVKQFQLGGVAAIIADVGYSMQFQISVQRMTTTPVFLSSLMQVALLRGRLAGIPQRKVIILTANSSTFVMSKMIPEFLMPADEVEAHIRLLGGQNAKGGKWVCDGNSLSRLKKDAFEVGACIEDGAPDMANFVSAKVKEIQDTEGGEVVAVVIECTEMPEYANAIRYKTGLPVFDVMTLADWVSTGTRAGLYSAFVDPK